MKKATTMLSRWVITISALAWALTAHGAERPNVVLMLADNLGFGDIGAYGGGAVLGTPTPSLDALAAEGLMLTQFFVEPGCPPGRGCDRALQRSLGAQHIIVAGTATSRVHDCRAAYTAIALPDGQWHPG